MVSRGGAAVGRTQLLSLKKLLLCEITAQKFPLNLSEITQERGYCARINFPVSETEQFWGKMLALNCITVNPCMVIKLRIGLLFITLVFGSNTSSGFQLRCLLCSSLWKFQRTSDYIKGSLLVIWKSNTKTWGNQFSYLGMVLCPLFNPSWQHLRLYCVQSIIGCSE